MPSKKISNGHYFLFSVHLTRDQALIFQDALLVKEGKLERIPQAYIFLEGIWPPALVPLFIRDGCFPEFVDADVPERELKKLKRSSANSYSVRRQMVYRDVPQQDDEANNNAGADTKEKLKEMEQNGGVVLDY